MSVARDMIRPCADISGSHPFDKLRAGSCKKRKDGAQAPSVEWRRWRSLKVVASPIRSFFSR